MPSWWFWTGSKGTHENEQRGAMNDCDTNELNESESFLSILTTSPSDWQLILNERLALIDWDSKSRTFAQPCGNFLTVLFYIIRLLQDNLIKPNMIEIKYEAEAFDFSKSEKLKQYEYLKKYSQNAGTIIKAKNEFFTFKRLAKVLDISIIILVIWNILLTSQFLYFSYRTYSLFYLRNNLKSRNLTKHSLNALDDDIFYDKIIGGSFWNLIKFFFVTSRKANKKSNSLNENQFYYQLKKWAPSKFKTYFFMSFSPTCLVFLLFSEVSFRTAFAVLLHQVIVYFVIVHCYEQRLVDETILVSATSSEIDEKFVKPRISKIQQDVQIDATPYGDGFVRFFPPSTKSHIFKSHSLTGDTVTEKYNTRTGEFEDVTMGSKNAHNLVIKPLQLNPYVLYRDPYGSRFDRFGDGRPNVYYREESPSRMSTPPGLYSPVLSTVSGMSIPYFRAERSQAFMSNLPVRQNLNYNKSLNGQSRRDSKSPLRQSVLSSQHLDDAKMQKQDQVDNDLRTISRSNFSSSSRSSSKSPIHKR